MEKETKKKNTTGAKKTTSAKKGTTTKKTASAAKAKTNVNETAKNTTKKSNNVVKKTTKSNTKKSSAKVVPTKTSKVEVEKEIKKETVEVNKKKNEIKANKVKETAKVEKETKEVKETTLAEELKSFIKSDVGSLVGIVLIIVIVMGAFFFITDFIKGLNNPEQDPIVSQEIQYDEIILSNLLKQPNSAYYVLIFDEGTEAMDINDIDIQTYQIYLDVYSTLDNSLRVYSADLTKKFNEPYVAEENSNLLVSNIEELKVKSTTLVKVENGVVVAAFETRDSIIEHLTVLVG